MGYKNRFNLMLFFFALASSLAFSQGDRCANIRPFCAGSSQYIFSNSNRNNSSESTSEFGPYYACLDTRPYPAWFFLKIGENGNLDFEISQTVNPDGSGETLDVDFIAWGPFAEDQNFCNSLTAGNVVDCSYLPATIENFSIANARAGQIYVVLITNYSEAPGYISLSQTNAGAADAGSTDCSIVNLLGDDKTVCGANSVDLVVMNVNANVFEWFKYDEATNDYIQIPDESGRRLTVTEPGRYKVTAVNSVTGTEVSDDLLVTFGEQPVAGTPGDINACSDDPEMAMFDLTSTNPDLFQDYNNPSDFSTNFYLSQSDFENHIPIESPATFTGNNNQQITATITNNESGCTSAPVQFALKISGSIDVSIPEITNLCLDSNGILTYVISLGKDLGPGFTYSWTPTNDPDGDGNENPIFYIDEAPAYESVSLTVTNLEVGCTASYTTQLHSISAPQMVNVSVSGNGFGDGYVITAGLQGAGGLEDYEYQLDNGSWQNSEVFQNVPAGTHTVSARQLRGCAATTSQPFQLVGYKRFFTPNADGYNDTWNIVNVPDFGINIKKILIFDRFGKFIQQLDPNGPGWDGKLNGNNLPADDYWFYIEYSEKNSEGIQKFKGHFSLKR